MCLTCWPTEKNPRQGSPLSAWMGRAMQKDWPKKPFDCQLQEARKKTLREPLLLRWRQSMALHTWHRQGPCKPSSCAIFMLSSHWGRAATGKKKVLQLCSQGRFSSVWLWPCRLWPARPLYQGGGFSRQEYWSVLANTGCHTLLEHYISCCPSCQPPWVPGAARTSETQTAVPPPHLALTGANPSPPGKPQEQTPVDDPRAEVEIKPQLKPRGSVVKEEDPKPSHQLYKLQIKSTRSTRQTLSMEYIEDHWALP